MEAPKFRAWISEADTMTNDLKGIDFENNTVVLKKIHWEDGFPVEEEVFEVEIGNAILMQSTGLHDKTGVEIFEGDVVRQVRTQPTTENEIIIGIVTMIEGTWLIMNDCEQLASKLWSETDENEIIGNSYETPELLEDTMRKRSK